jgi:hypothetical protein
MLKYEPKRHLRIRLPSKEQREFFLRGNMRIGEVLQLLGFSSDKYSLIMQGKPLDTAKMLKDYDIEAVELKVWPR